MPFFTSRNIKLLITINIFAILIFPQLNNVHYDPLPQFWAETITAWLIISLFLIVCFSNKRVYIPKVTIPLSLLAIYIAVQPQLLHISFPGLSYITSMELFLCILLATAISTITVRYGLADTVTIFAQALVTGAIIQSAIGFLQYTGHYNLFGGILFYDSSHPTTNIFGHFGQRNHYCHYISWAIFGLIYLYLNKRILRINFYTILLWFMFSMTIAASRSVFIYFALALIISGIYLLIKRNSSARQLLINILISTLALVIFEYGYAALQHILHADGGQIQSGLQRLTSEAASNGTDRRIVEWHKAWITFKTNPIFGFGFNGFAHQSVFLQPLFKHTPANDGLFTNCHNLILQFMAETGIIGTLIIICGSIWSIYGLLKRVSPEIIIILCMIATSLAHSMVEYPLWYFYFLGPLIMFMALDKPIRSLSSNCIKIITILPITGIIYLLITGSIIYNNLVNYTDVPTDKTTFINQARYLQNLADNNTLWAYSALYTLDNYINVNDNKTNIIFDSNTQIKYELWLTYSHPYPDNLLKVAMLNWNIGNYTQARQYATMAIMAFPVYKKSLLTTLGNKRYTELAKIIQEYKD